MAKSNTTLLKEIKKLTEANAMLKHQLDDLKINNIDAVIIPNKNKLKVYTEISADKTYRILIENMHEGAVTLNKNGTIAYCNSHFASMIKLPLQKVIGKKFSTFINDTSKKHIEALLTKGRKNPIKEEIPLYTSTGKSLPVLISINALALDKKILLSLILTDLTVQNKNQEELKNKSNQLEQKNLELEIANKDLTSFTYISSHDMQEPLRKIRNFISCILNEEGNLSAESKMYLQRAYETAKRMQNLIEDLLSFSRTKNYEHKLEKTDLNVIVNDVKNDLKEEILEKKAIIQSPKLCEVNIIPFQFSQILYNLISNSLKFSRVNVSPHITIKAKNVKAKSMNNKKYNSIDRKLSTTTNYCHITYTDNGIGFENKYKERIFDMFQRLHSKEEFIGTGIGLAICKRIIENHNGIITATGKLNQGARFDIYIPDLPTIRRL